MGVEIIHDQVELFSIGKMHLDERFEILGEVNFRASLADDNGALIKQWRKAYKTHCNICCVHPHSPRVSVCQVGRAVLEAYATGVGRGIHLHKLASNFVSVLS